MAVEFNICPKCGVRNFVRPGGSIKPDHCIKCDPKPDVPAFNVQVLGRRATKDGPVLNYLVRLVDPDGEVIFIKEPMERDAAREFAKAITENVLAFVEGLEKSFRCPQCGIVSHNPNDMREGYCGCCHAWTGRPTP